MYNRLYTDSIRSRQGSIVIVPGFVIDVAKAPIMAGTPTPRSLVTDGSSSDPGHAESIGHRHGSIVIEPGVVISLVRSSQYGSCPDYVVSSRTLRQKLLARRVDRISS